MPETAFVHRPVWGMMRAPRKAEALELGRMSIWQSASPSSLAMCDPSDKPAVLSSQ